AEGKHIVYTFGDSQGNKIFLNLINNALRKGDTQVFEDMEVSSKRGTLRLRGRISPKSEAGTFSGAIITFQDPSEVEQIRGWLKQADQMAGLGTMAAGIAHEIRNPLASIRGLMELLREDIVETDPKRKYVDTVINEVDRVNKLVQEVLDFAQVETTEPEARDINELIEQALIITKHRLPDKAIEIVEDLVKNLPPVFVRPDKITQAFENILVNAFEATPEGGKVVVTSGLEPFPSRTKNEKYRNVLVRFSNTGSFIAPENIEKIFLPFYTTKPGGTGLGLPICHRIISSLGGEIRVESHRETGTTFEIELPTASWIFKK
ncbi:MAG TPA: two-component system sensor histidine kinase NtrB, partial [Candidatus Hypogeohydataceae bacterium YC38]